MKKIYCPDCNVALVIRNVNDSDIMSCTNCGKIFIHKNNKYRYVGQTSGNNSTRELLSFIDAQNKN